MKGGFYQFLAVLIFLGILMYVSPIQSRASQTTQGNFARDIAMFLINSMKRSAAEWVLGFAVSALGLGSLFAHWKKIASKRYLKIRRPSPVRYPVPRRRKTRYFSA